MKSLSKKNGSLIAAGTSRKRARAAAPATEAISVDWLRHRIRGANWVPSPNCDARPAGARIDLLVVHAISLPPGEFGGPWIDKLFTNRLDPKAHPYFATIDHLKVSAHACIFRTGAITQYVPLQRRAWHAGESTFQGRTRCNDFSIGVELEGCDDKPFADVQYIRLAQLARGLMQGYPGVTPARIVGHSDIAPVRKTDPGPHFDWARLTALLK